MDDLGNDLRDTIIFFAEKLRSCQSVVQVLGTIECFKISITKSLLDELDGT